MNLCNISRRLTSLMGQFDIRLSPDCQLVRCCEVHLHCSSNSIECSDPANKQCRLQMFADFSLTYVVYRSNQLLAHGINDNSRIFVHIFLQIRHLTETYITCLFVCFYLFWISLHCLLIINHSSYYRPKRSKARRSCHSTIRHNSLKCAKTQTGCHLK